MDLRPEYYREALLAEQRLVAVLVVDRKLVRLDCVRRIRPELMCDVVAAHALRRLQADPFTPVRELVILDAWWELALEIFDSFWWWVEWYASEVQRFIGLRVKLLDYEDFRYEHCD